jgi:hypothetical protein
MRWANWRTVALGIALLAAIVAGHVTGRVLPGLDCAVVTLLVTLLGVVLALTGAGLEPQPHPRERAAGLGLIGYVVLSSATWPFALAHTAGGVAVGVAWLTPVAVAGMVLPRRGCWLVGVGCWAVLFSGSAALAYTATHPGAGMGLVFAWRG